MTLFSKISDEVTAVDASIDAVAVRPRSFERPFADRTSDGTTRRSHPPSLTSFPALTTITPSLPLRSRRPPRARSRRARVRSARTKRRRGFSPRNLPWKR